MSSTIEDLNNKAVSLLTQGNYQEALAMLKSALCPFLKSGNVGRSMNSSSTTQQRQQEQQQQQPTQRQQTPPQHNEQHTATLSLSPNDKAVYVQDENIVLFQQDGPSAAVMSSEFTMPSMMYSKAFCISPPKFDKSDLQSYAVMCYNMALILHGQGIQLGVSVAFPKALTMYSLSMRLLHQVYTTREEITKREDVSHIYLAILNNMGDVYQQLVQEEQASFCFQQLGLFLRHLAQGNDEELLYRFGFFASNSVSSQYEFPPSPAAAA